MSKERPVITNDEWNVTVLIADDEPGHVNLVKRNLKRAGILNEIMHFNDGQEILDFLFRQNGSEGRDSNTAYLLLLDIRMPKVDGVEVLRRIKECSQLRSLPVIMLTTTDDPREVTRCHELGCNNYVTKPVDYEEFVNAIQRLGMFLRIVKVPELAD